MPDDTDPTIATVRVHTTTTGVSLYRRHVGVSDTWLDKDGQVVSDPTLAAALDTVAGLSAPPITK